jgi:hypothetical protein
MNVLEYQGNLLRRAIVCRRPDLEIFGHNIGLELVPDIYWRLLALIITEMKPYLESLPGTSML